MKETLRLRRLPLKLHYASCVFLIFLPIPNLISDLPDMFGETLLFQRVCYLWIEMRRNVV